MTRETAVKNAAMGSWRPPTRLVARLIALLPAACLGGVAEAGETLRWAISDVPMVHEYPQGRAPRRLEELGQANGDRVLRYLAAEMPEFQHELVDLPLLRLRRLLHSDEDFCSVLMPRTLERVGLRHYTPLLPALEGLRMHLVLRAETARQLGLGTAPVQLLALLQRHAELRGHYNPGRTLPPPLLAALAELGPRGPSALPVSSTETLLRMLQKGRMDYSFESGAAVQRFNAEAGEGAVLLALPLVEAGPAFAVHLSCSRSVRGARQIAAIDLALRRLAEQPLRYRELVWAGPMSEADQRQLQQFLADRVRGGPLID